jgi:hypothetical protein
MQPENISTSQRSCFLAELEYTQRSFVAIKDAIMGIQNVQREGKSYHRSALV